MSVSQVVDDDRRSNLYKVAAGGILTGILTPLCPPLIDSIVGRGDVRIALLAGPFAILVFVLFRRSVVDPWWAALVAAIVTMVAFVAAVNAAIWVDGHIGDAAKSVRNVFAGLAGGFVGSGLMALGLCLLRPGPRHLIAWLPMLIIGTLAGALWAVDNGLDLDRLSVLYPVWQAGVAVGLTMALQRGDKS
jgi:hypothetical protein